MGETTILVVLIDLLGSHGCGGSVSVRIKHVFQDALRVPPGSISGKKCYLCVRNGPEVTGAGNGIRTRDFNLGKVALYH